MFGAAPLLGECRVNITNPNPLEAERQGGMSCLSGGSLSSPAAMSAAGGSKPARPQTELALPFREPTEMRKPNFSAYPASVDGTRALLVTDGGKVASGACNAGCKNGVQLPKGKCV